MAMNGTGRIQGKPVDGARPEKPATQEKPEQPHGEPTESDRSSFEKVYFAGEAGDGKKKPDAGDGTEERQVNVFSLFQGATAAHRLADPAAGEKVGKAEAAGDVAFSRYEELVEQILVSEPGMSQTGEVRLKVDRSWLPDTEVRLQRRDDGALAVEFVSDDVDAQRTLLPNLGALRERLADSTGSPVVVRMSEHQQSDFGQGDGRSRNRRNLYEEYSNGSDAE